jgi:hypothetical protein
MTQTARWPTICGLYLILQQGARTTRRGRRGSSPPPFSSSPVAPALQKKKNNTISKIFGRTSPARGGFPKPARKVDTKADVHNSWHEGPHIHNFGTKAVNDINDMKADNRLYLILRRGGTAWTTWILSSSLLFLSSSSPSLLSFSSSPAPSPLPCCPGQRGRERAAALRGSEGGTPGQSGGGGAVGWQVRRG